MLETIIGVAGKVLDQVIPDPEARRKAKARMAEMAQTGELKKLQARMSAIKAEATSDDPWTSRARPSFMYVIYIFILTAIPMGVVSAFSPETAAAIAQGANAWLDAIPNELYTLFGAGYLGYAGARTWDKHKRQAEATKRGERP